MSATHHDRATCFLAGRMLLDLAAETIDDAETRLWIENFGADLSADFACYQVATYFERPEDVDPDPDRTLETDFHYAAYCAADDLAQAAEDARRMVECFRNVDLYELPDWVERVVDADRRHEPERKRMRAEREKRDAERMAAHIAKYPHDDGLDSIGHQLDICESGSA